MICTCSDIFARICSSGKCAQRRRGKKISSFVPHVISIKVKIEMIRKSVLGETDPVTRRMSITAKRRKLGSKRRSLEEKEEVLGKGEPIRSQESDSGVT